MVRRPMSGGGMLEMTHTPMRSKHNDVIELPAGLYRRGDGDLTEYQYVGLPITCSGTIIRTMMLDALGTMMVSIQVNNPSADATIEHIIVVEIRLSWMDRLHYIWRTRQWQYLRHWWQLEQTSLGLAPNLPMGDMRNLSPAEIQQRLMNGMEAILKVTDPTAHVQQINKSIKGK